MTQDEARRIYERLDAVKDKLAELASAVSALQAGCAPCKQRMGEHHRILHGNGQAGLVIELERLKSELSGRRWWFRWGAGLASGIVVALVTAVATAWMMG